MVLKLFISFKSKLIISRDLSLSFDSFRAIFQENFNKRIKLAPFLIFLNFLFRLIQLIIVLDANFQRQISLRLKILCISSEYLSVRTLYLLISPPHFPILKWLLFFDLLLNWLYLWSLEKETCFPFLLSHLLCCLWTGLNG